jgi:predicted nucleotidyltransferase
MSGGLGGPHPAPTEKLFQQTLVKGKFQETSDIDLAVAGIPPESFFQALGKVNLIRVC